jgi:hypothetical protein
MLLVALLLGLASWFGWRQVQVLRELRRSSDQTPEDRRYLHRQAWRRLVGCGLMVLLAALLAGWYVLGFHEFATHFRDEPEAANGALAQSPEEARTLRICAYYLIGSLLTLLGMLGIAALDFWSIRSYALRQHRQIQADRRAMIERQVARLRQEGNGREH